jgi:cytoskeletal protein CcmA (bactofilin family)
MPHMRLRAALLAVLATFALTAPVAAGEFRSDSTVTVGAAESIDDDLYAAAGTVVIDGTVNGDATVAGATVQVNGTVTGSLNVGGGSVEVLGDVGGAVRVSAGTVRISGSVGRDVVAFGGNVTIDSSAVIAGDVAGGVGSLTVAGSIGGDLLASAGTITVSGTVDGAIEAGAGQLTIESGAVIGGNVTYTSSNEAVIDDGAQIGGEVTRKEPAFQPQTSVVPDNPIVSYLGFLLGMLLLGYGLLALRPRFTIGSAETLKGSPLVAAGVGLGTVIGQFVLVIILVLLAALVGILASALGGAFVVVAIVVLLLIVLGIILATIPVAMALGRVILPDDSSAYLAYLAGAAILSVIVVASGYVPALGALVFFIVWCLGLGAFVVYLSRTRERPFVLAEPAPSQAVMAPPTPPSPA